MNNASRHTTTKSTKSIVAFAMKFLIPLAVSVGLCYMLFSRQDMGQMMEIIRSQCDFRWIALALGLSICSHVFRAMRWRIQLRAIGVETPLFIVVLSIFGTYAVNLVAPRLGELWRTSYIAQRQKAPFDTVFGSMMADRLADTATVALITLVTFFIAGNAFIDFLHQPENVDLLHKFTALLTSPWLWTGLAIAAIALWLILTRMRGNRLVAKVIDFGKGLWEGFAAVATMKGKGRWLLLTVCLWGCYFTQLFVAFFAFPATAQVVQLHGVSAVLVCFVISSISMAVPSNGGIGPYQWALMFALGLYSAGIPELTEAYALSFANVVMGTQTLLLIILGLFTFTCIALNRNK